MSSYSPRGWRKLFPKYWNLAKTLEKRDREMERQYHHDIDKVYAEIRLNHVRHARKVEAPPHVYQRIDSTVRIGAEHTHQLLEDRGIRR